jgi:alpha-glucosidase
VPLAAVWIEDWSGERDTGLGTRLWWNWEPDRGRYPDWPDLVAELATAGVRTVIYFNPYLVDVSDKPDAVRNLHAEAAAAGHLVRGADGAPVELSQGGFRAGIVDLTSPGARAFLEDVIADQLALGVAGFMADFGEALPLDVELASGDDPAAFHNLYPVAWAQVTEAAIAAAGAETEAIAFHRSGYLGSPAHASLFWIGDQLVTWDTHDGLGTVVPALVSGGLSGFALSHGDIGGYTSIDTGPFEYLRTRELLWRWIEVAAFTALYRTHETPLREKNVQIDADPETLAHFARFAQLFADLGPYRQALMDEAAATGAPLARHLLLHAPDDLDAWDVSDEMMLGPDLLIAPVVEEGATEREVYLPAGRWVHVWSGDEHGDPERGTRVTVAAPPGQPPVFHRAGAAVGEVWAK